MVPSLAFFGGDALALRSLVVTMVDWCIWEIELELEPTL
jgi:hypothetical protein